MRNIFKIIAAFAVLFSCHICKAQKFSVSTDLMGYVRLCTLNADLSYAVSRHWDINAGIRYNPFTYRAGDPDTQFQYRQLSYAAGVRFWPWHLWSGWWFASRLRYQEYNKGGILSPATEEGDRLGAGLYSGYTYMLSPHLNLEFGIGLWGGMARYSKYSCPLCGSVIERGEKMFLLPDEIMISLAYVF